MAQKRIWTRKSKAGGRRSGRSVAGGSGRKAKAGVGGQGLGKVKIASIRGQIPQFEGIDPILPEQKTNRVKITYHKYLQRLTR